MITATITTKTLFIVSTSSAGDGLRCPRHARPSRLRGLGGRRQRVPHRVGGKGRSAAVQVAGDGSAAICLEEGRGRLPAGRLAEQGAPRGTVPRHRGAPRT